MEKDIEEIPSNLTGVGHEAEKNAPELTIDCEEMAAAALLVRAN